MVLIAEQKATAAASVGCDALCWAAIRNSPAAAALAAGPRGAAERQAARWTFKLLAFRFIFDHFVALIESQAAVWVERKRRTTKYL